MKIIIPRSFYSLILITLFLAVSACAHHTTIVHSPAKLPPGQAKKVTGSQSAKPYAPGQEKKKN